MRHARTYRLSSAFLLTALLSAPLLAGTPPAAEQIAAAVLPAPPELREAASVLGYDPEGRLVELREGEGDLICLADDPAEETVHVACYHRDLEPFMKLGRDLRAEGLDRAAVQAGRKEAIEAGKLSMPDGPRALYSLTAPAGSWDPAKKEISGARRVFVLYVPYATEETTGLSPQQMVAGAPWIMAPGEPWAHVMIVQGPEEKTEAAKADPADDGNEN